MSSSLSVPTQNRRNGGFFYIVLNSYLEFITIEKNHQRNGIIVGKRTLKVIIFVIVVIFFYTMVNKFFMPKDSYHDKWDFFYELNPNTIDIVFLGSSHSYRTFNPIIINHELEIDSYSMGMNDTKVEYLYYQLKEITKTQSPKVITIEVFSFIDLDKHHGISSMAHNAVDTMKLSFNKHLLIQNLIPKEEKTEYYFPIFNYHNRWKDTDFLSNTSDFYLNNKTLTEYYGYTPYEEVKYDSSSLLNKDVIYDFEIKHKIKNERLFYFQKIIDLCEQNQIKLILLVAPYETQYEISAKDLRAYTNSIEQYLKDKRINNVEIVDFNLLSKELRFQLNDLSDVGHVNISGAYKVSKYLAEYLQQNNIELFENSKYDYKYDSEKKYEQFMLNLANFLK